MVDTVRGVLRVRKWPRKRGTPKSASQLWWIDWFRQANKLAKYIDAASMRRAIELTAGTGKYPRDIILQAMRGRLYVWQDQNGKVWYPMAAVQDISETLDVLAQTVGSVLARAGDRWRSLAPGIPGDVLTSQGPGVLPSYQPAAGGGGWLGGALVSMSGLQSIVSWVWTPVIFQLATYDTHAIHDPALNPSRLIVPAGFTGVQLHGTASWPWDGAGYRIARIWKNGAPVVGCPSQMVNSGAAGPGECAIASPLIECIPGDYFELAVFQGKGSNLNLTAGVSTWLSMTLLK